MLLTNTLSMVIAIVFTMHILLHSEPVTATISSDIAFNLLSRARASTTNVDSTASVAELSLTVGFDYKAVTLVIPFIIIESLPEWDIVLGTEWNNWCMHNNRMFYMLSFFFGHVI